MEHQTVETNWIEEEEDGFDGQIDEYELTSTPNDFNVLTIFSFIESGAVKIPGFQRNYVWDIKRASKLVESLILGLPVPQVFLYEEAKNSFLVIDGQQRLMSMYYFMKQRFPRKEKRAELRRILEDRWSIPDELLHNDEYFTNFRLSLPESHPGMPNKFRNMAYATLGDYKTQFDLRPIRNIVVRQNVPTDDDSAVFEIFNRLNTGGMNLMPQEIRSSMYHSPFYTFLHKINRYPHWRRFLGVSEPDFHMKDTEVLLRGYAMLIAGDKYVPSMTRFLNLFSKRAKSFDEAKIERLDAMFTAFLKAATELPNHAFVNKRTGRFSVAFFEAIFYAVLRRSIDEPAAEIPKLTLPMLMALEDDAEFVNASQVATAISTNVKKRLQRANAIINGA